MILLDAVARIGAELLVLVALFGFGDTFSQKLSLRLTVFQSATAGLACFIVAGGLFGALGIYTRSVIAAELLLGAGLGLYQLWRRLRSEANRGSDPSCDWLAAVPFVIAGLFAVLVAQHGYWFSTGDDMQGYMPLVRKLSDTGVLGNSSFSEKRLFDLGGASVVQAVFAGMFDVSAVNLADLGIGSLLLLGLVGERAVTRRYSLPWSILLALAVVAMNANGRLVVSPVLLIEALCLFLGILLLEDAPLTRRHYIVWGLAMAALIALKSTAIVFLGMFSIGIFLIDWSANGPRAAFMHAATAAMVALLCLSPYLYASARYVGTAWFPLLGTGFQDPAIGDGMLGRTSATTGNAIAYIFQHSPLEIVLLIALGVALYGLASAGRLHRIRNFTLAATLVVVVIQIVWSSFAIGDSDHAVRYAMPFYAAILLALLLDWRTVSDQRRFAGWVLAGGVLVAIPYCTLDAKGARAQAMADLVFGLTGSPQRALAVFDRASVFPLLTDQADYARLQQAAAPGTRMLVYVDRPFLFDYSRNRIETGDCAGRTSPPPGLHLHSDDGAIVRYLRGVGVRYLAFSYYDNDGYPPALMKIRMNDPDHPWSAYCTRGMLGMYEFIGRARKAYRTVYQDKANYLLDLSRPATEHREPPRL